MFFRSIVKMFNNAHDTFKNNELDEVDPNLVKYYRIEYGKDWKVALQHHLYKKSIKNIKKAA